MDRKKRDFKTLFSEIKSILSFDTTQGAGDQAQVDAFKDYDLKDGGKLKIDKLEAGGKVMKDDGTTAAAAGDYTFADGTVITVSDKGEITEVKVPSTDPAPSTEVAMREIAAKFATGTPEDRIAGLETMCLALMEYCFGWKIDQVQNKAIEEAAIAAYQSLSLPQTQQVQQMSTQLAAIKMARTEDNKKYTTAFAKLGDIITEFADAPSDDAIVKPNTTLVASKADRRDKAALNIAASLQTAKPE